MSHYNNNMAAATKTCGVCCQTITDKKSYRSLSSTSCQAHYGEVYAILSLSPQGKIACNWCVSKFNRLSKLIDLTNATALKQEKDALITKIKSLPGLHPGNKTPNSPRTPKGKKRFRADQSTPTMCTPKSKKTILSTPTPRKGLFRLQDLEDVGLRNASTQTTVYSEDFDVKVIVKYKGEERSRIIREDAEKSALKAVLNNHGPSTVIKSLAKGVRYKNEMLRVVNSEISREISVLTKKDSKVFQGHASDSGALLTFDWKEQSCDLQTLSPFLYSIFSKAVGLQSKKNLSCMMTSAAVLLYSRSQKLCQLQYILGLILDSCGLTKEGIQIIHDLGLSPSSLHKKKKALITQQKKSIAKVVTGYVEHVETNYEKDLEHLFMESNQPDRLLTQNDISLTVERPQDSNDEEDFGDVLMEADDQHGTQDMSMRLKDITGTLQNTLYADQEISSSTFLKTVGKSYCPATVRPTPSDDE